MNVCDERELRALLRRHGFRFSKSMGQNFLIADWVPREIAAASGAAADTGVLEIGPGIGALTRELSALAGRVTCVELDRTLLPLLGETLDGCRNVNVLFGDILKMDLTALTEQEFAGLKPMVCANLPYNITSPVLSRLLACRLFSTITVMVQREVAQRICAAPGEKECSAFSLYCQYFAECRTLFEIPPECFLPAPKVTSAVIQLRQRDRPPVSVEDEALFFRTIRAGFALRRKTLANSLATAFPDWPKAELTRAITDCGLSPTVRGEVLSLADYAALSARLKEDFK